MKQIFVRLVFLLQSGFLVPSVFVTNTAAAQALPGCELISDSPALVSTVPRIQGLIRSKKFAAVEDEWKDKLSRVGRPSYPDFLLYAEIQRVVSDDPALEPLIQQWKNERPNSFLVQLASGVFHSQLGYKKRGTALARDTSKEQFEAMRIEHSKALLDLERATELGQASAIPFAAMMNIMRSQARRDAELLLLSKAGQADKGNLSARWARIKSISLAWGGSDEMLDSYYDEVGSEGLPDSSVRFLRYSILMQKAHGYDEITKEGRKAISTWKQAVALCQYAEEPLRSIMRVADGLEDWVDLRDAASKLLVVQPKDASVHNLRGWANLKLEDYPAMEKDYVKASELGWIFAQNRIGYFYMTGQHLKKDLIKARYFLQMAANSGNTNAVENLRWLNQYGDKK